MHNVVGEPRVYDGGGLLVHFPSPFLALQIPCLYLEAELLSKRQYVQVANGRDRRLAL